MKCLWWDRKKVAIFRSFTQFYTALAHILHFQTVVPFRCIKWSISHAFYLGRFFAYIRDGRKTTQHDLQNPYTQCRNPGSSRGPLDLQSNALPTELIRPGTESIARGNSGVQKDWKEEIARRSVNCFAVGPKKGSSFPQFHSVLCRHLSLPSFARCSAILLCLVINKSRFILGINRFIPGTPST